MFNEKTKTDILFTLYEAWLSGPTKVLTLPEISDKLSLEVKLVKHHCRLLSEDWSVEHCYKADDEGKEGEKTDAYYLCGLGIDSVEELLTASAKPENLEIVRKNESVRKAILEGIQELRQEFPSYHGSGQRMSPEFEAAYYRKMEEKNLDKQRAGRNFYYLLEAHHISLDSEYLGGEFFYEVSSGGYELLKKYAAREQQAAERLAWGASFEALKSGEGLTPQARGHALERLLKSILESEGWHCELNVRTPSQENDLIAHQGREYMIVECKWEEKKAAPEYVSRLRDKVLDRPEFCRGILISMSGFTDGVADCVRQRLSSCMILLFSGPDIEDIVYGRKTFTGLLDERFHAAMSRTEIVVGDTPGEAKPKARAKRTPTKPPVT